MVATQCAQEAEGGSRVWVSQCLFGFHGAGDEVYGRYSVVIITNQALKSAALAEWKRKIPVIGTAVSDVYRTAVHSPHTSHLGRSSRMCLSESLPPPRGTAFASPCRACGTNWNGSSRRMACR